MKKVSELEGAELDFFVAKAEGLEAVLQSTHPIHGYKIYEGDEPICWALVPFDPEDEKDDEEYWEEFATTWHWHIGGPIIEREKIFIRPLWHATTGEDLNTWLAGMSKFYAVPNHWHQEGPTPLIAAMRAYVSSKFGEEVDA